MARFKDNSKAVLAKFRRAMDKATRDTAREIAKDASELAPVDSGDLEESYTSQKMGDAHYQTGSPLEYSVYQELGTEKQNAQPHLMPAYELNKDAFVGKFKNGLR